MARKEKPSNKWIESETVGAITLFLSKRSPFWWMYWREPKPKAGTRQVYRSTRETDLSLARLVAGRQNETLFRRKCFGEQDEATRTPIVLRSTVDEFLEYLQQLARSYDHIKNLRGRLGYLCDWMEERGLKFVHEVTPSMVLSFSTHLVRDRGLKASTANDYVDAVHNFFGYAIYKRQLVPGPNPASTGRQSALDRTPEHVLPPPTITPEQVNAVIKAALAGDDRQVVNLIVFVCEGGFRFQELQFLQVGDLNLKQREIILDVKRPNPRQVRPELQRRCLTPDGLWIPKSRAGRRPIHITDRLAQVIGTMGLGDPSDWVFANQAGNQIAGNKTLLRLKRYALDAGVLVEPHPKTGVDWSAIRWHWLRHYHRTRAHVCQIRREVSKVAMGHAADPIHDHYRGLDAFAFHAEYAKFDSGLDDALLVKR